MSGRRRLDARRGEGRARAIVAAGVLSLAGCSGLLDVDNPNSVPEDAIGLPSAANGVANGAQALVWRAIADYWEAPAVVSNELYWIGSRDAWGALDEGFVSDISNEFTDEAFPPLGEAVWSAQNADPFDRNQLHEHHRPSLPGEVRPPIPGV